jgi:hypothetical protein
MAPLPHRTRRRRKLRARDGIILAVFLAVALFALLVAMSYPNTLQCTDRYLQPENCDQSDPPTPP